MRPSERNAYEEAPSVHSGHPNSAFIGQSAWTSPSRSRKRFHHPVRSETKWSSPAGLHDGWKIDSRREPATRRSLDNVSSGPTSATHTSHPSHGMSGRSHVNHVILAPSGDKRGPAKKSRPSFTTRASPEPSVGIATSSFTTPLAPSVW